MVSLPPVGTFSIVACDVSARQWGVAVASKFLAVGAFVPWVAADVGALAVQAYTSPRFGPAGLALLRQGASADEALKQLLADDEQASVRQLAIVDARGCAASHTGGDCFPWAGGVVGTGFAAQGNILTSSGTVEALARAFESSADAPLADRLLDSLDQGAAAGGDRRGRQSAALLVAEKDAGYDGWDVLVDLRVDDHPDPISELQRLYQLHQLLFGRTPRERWVAVDDPLRAELSQRLDALGFRGSFEQQFLEWAQMENLEERLEGSKHIDPVVLAQLRQPS